MAEDGSEFWLYRADGGSVHFINDNNLGYQAREVFDPHGLLTTLHYNSEGNLDWVEQDGGRRLTIGWDCYSPPGQQDPCVQKVIGRVENVGSGGMQAVEYGYSWLGNYLTLTHAYYQNDPVPGQSVAATYTYESYAPPTGFFPAGPLLVTADDPRFPGLMRQIRYSYSGAGCRPQGQPEPGYPDGKRDYFYGSPTGIAAEKSWRTYFSTNAPIIVSSFGLGCFDGTRSESNGLGGFRKFFYGRSAGTQGDFSYTLASGAVQHYEYNGSNQLAREWNSVDGESAATIYTYYGADRPEWTGLVAIRLSTRFSEIGFFSLDANGLVTYDCSIFARGCISLN